MSGIRHTRGVICHSILARFETAIGKNASLEEISTLIPSTRQSFPTMQHCFKCWNVHSWLVPSINVIQFLLSRGNSRVLLQRCNSQGCTLLHLACKCNAPEQVIQLFSDINPAAILVASKHGMLPLHFACLYSSLSVVKHLVERNPKSIGARDFSVSLPIHYACRNKQSSLDIVKLLLQKQPNLVRQVNKEGRLPMHLACQTNTSLKLVELLATLYPNSLTQQDTFGCLPLHYVFERKHASLDILEFLLQKFPNGIYCSDKRGYLPLHKAACRWDPRNNNVECIQRLVQADIYTVLQTTDEGDSPLDFAYRNYYHKNNKHVVIQYLKEQQSKAIQEIRRAFDYVLDTQLGMPDLVVAEIWSYVWPDV